MTYSSRSLKWDLLEELTSLLRHLAGFKRPFRGGGQGSEKEKGRRENMKGEERKGRMEEEN